MSKNKIVDVLDYYGCEEVRIQVESRSLSEVEGALRRTHKSYVSIHGEPPRIRLIDHAISVEIGRSRIAVDDVGGG